MKKKLPTYTLVRRSLDDAARKSAQKVALTAFRPQSGKLAGQFSKLNKHFTRAVLDTVIAEGAANSKSLDSKLRKKVEDIARDVTRQSKVHRVGVLDLAAWVSGLPNLLERLNAAQPQFTFFEVQAPLPAGLRKTASWYEKEMAFKLGPKDRKELERQFYANDFFKAGENLRKHFGLDFLVGITPAMIAGIADGELYWNHFSSSKGPVLLISTAELREFSGRAERPFEAFVGHLLTAQLLVAMNSRLAFHEDRGCLFDYNQSRVSIIKGVANPAIEPECLQRIDPKNRDAARAFVNVLRRI